MALGILEPSLATIEHVPGTSQLEDIVPANTVHLKKASGNRSNIVLIPQPSSDPNDPLNWPLWQRDLLIVLYCYLTLVCVAGIGPIVSVMALDLIAEFGIDFTQISLLTGYQLCAVGGIAVFVAALGVKYGKRGVFIVSCLLCFVGCIWNAEARSYESMLGARVVQGLGTTAFESITFSVIGDLYFVHQRGARMALYILGQSGIIMLPTIIAGVVAENIGWRWVFWLLVVFEGIGLVALILFGWETVYNRNEVYNIDTSSHNNLQILEELKSGIDHQEDVAIQHTITTASTSENKVRHSFLKRMKPWSTTFTDDSLIKLILRPFLMLVNPAVIWAIIMISFAQLWNVMLSYIVAQIFSVPPYNFKTSQIGYVSVGPAIGGLLGCIFCGAISDPLVRALAKRNKGVFEPEFRLVLMVFMPIFCSIGYFGFGNLVEEGKSAYAMSALWGVAFVSVQITSNSAGSYIVDAFRGESVEIFIIAMCLKNFIFFGFSYILNDWITAWGPARVFDLIGGVMVGLSLSTIPVYVFGKRLRAWWHNHNPSRKL